MKAKSKRKTKQIPALTPQKVFRKSTRFMKRLVEKSGIPEHMSDSVAWFAERLFLAFLCIMAASFAAGALFVLKWSEPIAESGFYDSVARNSYLAQEGIKVYSQQVIDMASPMFGNLVKDNHKELVDTELASLEQTKEKLRVYLTSKNSPFANDEGALDAFVASKNMKLMVAISFVESTFGKHCYYFNCSGIGGTPPNLRKYDSYAEWIADFDQLLENRYKDLPPEKFIGLYVQPGSPNWLYGVKKVISEFEEHGIES